LSFCGLHLSFAKRHNSSFQLPAIVCAWRAELERFIHSCMHTLGWRGAVDNSVRSLSGTSQLNSTVNLHQPQAKRQTNVCLDHGVAAHLLSRVSYLTKIKCEKT
jgi:hypothetical protein